MISFKVQNLSRLVGAIDKEINRSRREDRVRGTVGYAAPYSVYVHENLAAYHETGQAKFLEQPARQMANSGELGKIVYQGRLAGLSQRRAIERALNELKRVSQRLVPVDTGFLRDSAFVEVLVGDEGAVA
jgi:hypothetical protein